MKRAHAVTLIETLATVALLALATAVLARGMTAVSPDRDAERALALFADFDAAARAMARTSGPVLVTARAEQLTAASPDAAILIERTLPDGWSITPDGWSRHSWLYAVDSAGRSDDGLLFLNGPQSRIAVRIDGLFGSVRKGEAP